MKEITLQRVGDVSNEKNKILLPIEGYENQRLMSLKEAVGPIAKLFSKDTLKTRVNTALQRCENPQEHLSKDESAAIMLYTFEWPNREESLYYKLNSTLRKENREELKIWFPYLRLFIGALVKLPEHEVIVHRGMNIGAGNIYQQNSAIRWWGFSSCTNNVGVLSTNNFLGASGDRTMFNIRCHSARDIKRHSYYAGESELLLLPGRYLKTTKCERQSDGLTTIELEEINPEDQLIAIPDVRPWRQFGSGLSLIGTCTSEDCPAHEQEVVISLNVEKYDVLTGTDLSLCPQCNRYVDCAKLGFCRCEWRLDGIKQTVPQAPERYTQDWTIVRGNTLQEYCLEGVTWRKLIIDIKFIDDDQTIDTNGNR